jgi:hypothetical protein
VLSAKTLSGVSFENYVMAFPADVTLTTTGGAELTASQDIPLGGAGRPWDETSELVRDKFLTNYGGPRDGAEKVIELVSSLEDVADARSISELLGLSAN